MSKHFFLILSLGFVAIFSGCGSDTDEDGETDYDDFYVAEEGETGTFTFDIEDDDINVGEATVFKVRARDRNGAPAKNVFVECFREEGLLFSESRGLTDDFGNFSGVVNCAFEGSWRMQCSSVAAGWQEFRTIRCR